MNYPIWQIDTFGGSLLIAIIAVVHVFNAHFAVGGGVFLVWTERFALRENRPHFLDFVKKHTHFFLLLTMVFGGVTGVGIWFIISLVHPAATSLLIHEFVFGWATEWVFFIVEIVSLLIYHYYFDKLSPTRHMVVGWIYAFAAWMSLFIINGIVAFMLTPGKWVEGGSFWSGFFNPGFWPSLVFRTAIALILAGLFGLVTAVFRSKEPFRSEFVKYCARWLVIPFFLLALGGFWYFLSIPGENAVNLLHVNPESDLFIDVFIGSSLVLFGSGLILLFFQKIYFLRPLIIVMVFIGLLWMGGFEYLREIARKPYVINKFMYSQGLKEQDRINIEKDGFLSHAKWTSFEMFSDKELLDAGEDLYYHQCSICHTRDGYNSLTERTSRLTEYGITAQLIGQGKVNTYMPPYWGTDRERKALSSFIIEHLQEKGPYIFEQNTIDEIEIAIVPFERETTSYVILAWNDLGMHCISDNDDYFVLLPPANNLYVQVIKRGDSPELISSGIRVHYTAEAGHKNPQMHVPFWKNVTKVFNIDRDEGVGLSGKKVIGECDFNDEKNVYSAEAIPVVPYSDDGTFNPYPLFTITVTDEREQNLLAQTHVVLPTSTEMGCRHCHDGPWRVAGLSGISDKTAENLLVVHDRMNKTNFMKDVRAGKPVLCQSCHGDPALHAPGRPEHLNLSAAIHGFHANYLTNMAEDACNACHPSRPEGRTRCYRGRHAAVEIRCIDCHGTMEDHALGLLKHEAKAGKVTAKKLMKNLTTRHAESFEMLPPRQPWLNEPDCLFCHKNFEAPEDSTLPLTEWTTDETALYRNRTDEMALYCAACHGAPHAIYPAENPYGSDRDNIQSLQYQGVSGTIATENNCTICHTQDMTSSDHHPNMVR